MNCDTKTRLVDFVTETGTNKALEVRCLPGAMLVLGCARATKWQNDHFSLP